MSDAEHSPKRVKLDLEPLPSTIVDVTLPTAADVSAVEVHEDVTMPERWIHLTFTWAGKHFNLELAESDRVYDLKASLMSLTNVPPERQKILGLVKGKLPPDQERIADIKLVAGKKFTLIGTPEGDEIKDPSQLEFLPDVVNDLDVDFTENPAAATAYKNDQRNIRKVREASQKLQINIIHPLREGKRLLVLDIDYTILDTKPLTSGSLPPAECARPGLHEFLEAIYPYYDICIWSQTSWIWLETKLVELGMIGSSRNYHISFVLDKTCMFTVFSERNGQPYSHSVKALQIIWNHFPQFNAKNTIHVDDLVSPHLTATFHHSIFSQSRNFALNPNEGLKIHAFKNAHTTQALADRELAKVARYLVHIASVADFQTLKHRDWKVVLKSLSPPS
ncbi:HAD subfamily IIID h [Leucogyrophana mollusca]|uniref:HAD subfamily IIID h n=1 Tax=Leucogyrophana mollusca TaxID=85980 RepID=A0ACB8BE77_9AGAM|nr:HAD subfamily IIID h [Leucogyrophana mollusca]